MLILPEGIPTYLIQLLIRKGSHKVLPILFLIEFQHKLHAMIPKRFSACLFWIYYQDMFRHDTSRYAISMYSGLTLPAIKSGRVTALLFLLLFPKGKPG